MALVNIPRSVTDAFYRYKMPALIVKVEGKGNGIKAVIVNMTDIAKALDRHPTYITKYFGFELGALTQIDEANDKYIVNGKVDQFTLAKVLDGFIDRYVLCKKCGKNPETKMLLKGDFIILHCKACGNRSDVDLKHKLTSYIVKNPAYISMSDDAPPKKEKRKSKKSKKDSSSEEDAGFEEEKTSKSKSKSKKKAAQESEEEEEDDDDGVVWYTDTSKEATELRRRQMIEGASQLAARLVVPEEEQEEGRPEAGVEEEEEEGDPIEKLHEFAKTKPTNSALTKKIRQVQLKEEWNDEQVAQVAFYLLFDSEVVSQLEDPSKLALLKEFVPNDDAQLGVLAGIVKLCGGDEDIRKSVCDILEALHENDILSEKVLVGWYEKKSKGNTAKVKEASADFIEDLRE